MNSGITIKKSLKVCCRGCQAEFSLQQLIKKVRKGNVCCPKCNTQIATVN